MANIHEVRITGRMPFSISETSVALEWLGIMNTPSYGIRISYGRSVTYVPSQWGGQTAMYDFIISGEEAIWGSGLRIMVKDLIAGGCEIKEAKARDLENRTPWFDLMATIK